MTNGKLSSSNLDPDGEIRYLVLWTTQKRKGFTDHYHAHESLDDAREHYRHLGKVPTNIYTASLCAIVESTDYPTHPKLKNA